MDISLILTRNNNIVMEKVIQMKSVLSHLIALATSLVIFLGLPVLAWDVLNIPRFFSSPPCLAYAIVICILQVFAILYNPKVGRYQEDRKSGVERHRVDLVLIQIFTFAIIILAPFSDGHSFGVLNLGIQARWLGFILLAPGFVLMQVAEKTLDRQFSVEVTLQKDHKLIQAGPYQYIRHPRYLGILSCFLGISLIFRSLLAVILVIALAAVFVWRMFAEEALMRQEFGEEWEAYRKKSWRIIPFVF